MSVVADRVAAALGTAVVGERRIDRGYTPADRRVLELADGRSVFAKAGTEELSSGWLHDEARLYSALRGDFMPELVAFLDEGPPVLVLEDLSGAHWPPAWSQADVDAVVRTLADVRATPPPAGLPRLAEAPGWLARGWGDVETDRAPFLSLQLCRADWLRGALPSLRSAADAAKLEGDELLHLDVRSDNVCIRDARALLVDWNLAVAGNADLDLAFWLPSLAAEGGPAPEEVFPGCPAELAALVAGFFAARAGLPPPPTAPRVRVVQRAQLRPALAWAARALDLPAPG